MGSRGIPNTNSMVSLKVDNISYRTTPDDLRPLFDKYGEIGDIYIPRDKYTKESRGFAFVRYYDRRDAEEAMDRLDGYNIDGRDIRVSRAMHPRPTNRFNSRGRSYGRSYRRSYSRSRSRSRSRDRRRRSRSRSRSRGRRYTDSRSPSRDRYERRERSYSRSRSRSRERESRSKSR